MNDTKRDGRSKTRLYKTYYSIRGRCYNPKNPAYYLYGGRGIQMCGEWRNSYQSFARWSLAHGYDPSLPGKLNSIDRIDPDGDYSPENCRWITMREQAANKRCVAHITYNGETHTLPEWSEITGIDYQTLYRRYRYSNCSAEDLLTTETARLYEASDGNKYTTGQIAEIAGITRQLAWSRLNMAGWSVDDVLAGKSRFRQYAVNGEETKSLHKIANESGINYSTLWARLVKQGRSIEDAMSPESLQIKKYTDASGRVYTLADLVEATGEKRGTLWSRINRHGWSVEECLAGHRFIQEPMCSVCGERAKGRGLCNRHLKRLRRYGSPMVTAYPKEPGEVTPEEFLRQHNAQVKQVPFDALEKTVLSTINKREAL